MLEYRSVLLLDLDGALELLLELFLLESLSLTSALLGTRLDPNPQDGLSWLESLPLMFLVMFSRYFLSSSSESEKLLK